MQLRIHNRQSVVSNLSNPQAVISGIEVSDCQPKRDGGVRCSAWLGSWSESSIDKLLNEQIQNPVPEPECGSIQTIGKFQPGLEIQNDGHGRFIQMLQCKLGIF